MRMMDSVLTAIERGATIVTATQRLPRAVRAAWAERQRLNGAPAWRTPDVLPWSAWLIRCYERLVDETMFNAAEMLPGYLSTAQEAGIWEQIIGESREGQGLLQIAATAHLAAEAWRLVHAWQIGIPVTDMLFGEDPRAFAAWARRFMARADAEGWVDTARLAALITRAWPCEPSPSMPKRIALYGFDFLQPQQRAFLEALSARGVEVEEIAMPAVRGTTRRVACATAIDEIWTAARWARRQLDAHAAVRIGVVVPELNDWREDVERVFAEVLHPATVLPGAGDSGHAFHVSLGMGLRDAPAIQALFCVLSLADKTIPIDILSQLLRSPYTGGAEAERGARARLDAYLRRRGETEYRPDALLVDLSGPTRRERLPVFEAQLRDTAAWRAAQPRVLSPSQWAERFSRLAALWRWPGERILNSTEHQTRLAWQTLLRDFATLDRVLPRLTLDEARERLSAMAAETVFQPEESGASVHILGILESAGMQFDYLWVMGLRDDVLPRPLQLNPFIPAAIQRHCLMPRSSPERELATSQVLLDRLLTSAPDVVVSYGLRDQDRELRPSPLIEPITPVAFDELGLEPLTRYRDIIFQAGETETLVDAVAPPLDEESARGGSDLLRLQAACPFRAFATYRLGAAALERPEAGLDARQRGILLHRVLQRLWSGLDGHSALCALPEARLRALVRESVAWAVTETASRRPETFTARFTALERDRLEKLVWVWLQLEKSRSPFTLAATEQRETVTLGGLKLRTTVDRVDRLSDGRQVVIDYKSSTPSIAQWFGERPDAPQLPLYATIVGPDVAALAFAQLRPGQVRLVGLAQDADLLPGVAAIAANSHAKAYASWGDLLSAWRQILERLAAEFRAGDARVDPKQYPQTCRYCELPTLCRINEVMAQDVDIPSWGDDDA